MGKDIKKPQLWKDWDGEYVGNIWGWKFSFFGLALILFLSLLLWYRFSRLDQTLQAPANTEVIIQKDTL